MPCGRGLVSAIGALALVGCSLLELGDLSAPQGDAPDSGAPSDDGSSPPGPVPVLPASDGGTADADAGSIFDVTCPSTDPTVTLCEDFETGDPTTSSSWPDKVVNGLLAVQPGIGWNGSRGLRARQDGMNATSWATSSGLAREIDSSFDVGRTIIVAVSFIVHRASSEGMTLFELQYDQGAFGLKTFTDNNCPNGEMCLSWGNQYVETLPWADAMTLTLDTWHRAEVTLSTGASGRSGRLVVDGRILREIPQVTASADPVRLRLLLGALFGKTTNEVTFDDLVIRRITTL